MVATQKRYEVQVGDKVVYSSNRIDHAGNRFNKESFGGTKDVILVDTKDNLVIESDSAEEVKAPKVVKKPSSKAVKAMAEKAATVKKVQAEKKAATKREHHCGDFVAFTLASLSSIKDVAKMTTALYAECSSNGASDKGGFLSTDVRRTRECNKIRSAAIRTNRGSGRMSLGLIIRKYCRFLNIDTAKKLDKFAK
jgi:hypothetical protein